MPHLQAKRRFTRKGAAAAGAAALAASALTAGLLGLGAGTASAGENHDGTATPIKQVVVIFQENVSSYFATYPKAANTPGETQQGTGAPAATFTAAKNTPKNINTLANAGLLAPNNPNSIHPARLSPMQAVTCSQDHNYGAEQKAYNGGPVTRTAGCPAP